MIRIKGYYTLSQNHVKLVHQMDGMERKRPHWLCWDVGKEVGDGTWYVKANQIPNMMELRNTG